MLEIRIKLFVLVGVLSSSLVRAQPGNICDNSTLISCDRCINQSPECAWCPIIPGNLSTVEEAAGSTGYSNYRCRHREDTQLPPCNDTSIQQGELQDPRNRVTEITEEPLTMDALNADGNIIQVTPQNLVVELRRGERFDFNMSFISLRNTPLDVYFLLDLSFSLQDSINVFRNDIRDIANALQNISTGFAIGLGSFIDKPILPYSLSNDEKIDSQTGEEFCPDGRECTPYSFHHSIRLTNNITEFESVLPNVSIISSNIDQPEGTLDALLQIALCTEEIGWRSDALKMVFIITDSNYHVAGDGRVAGLYKPNDGKCHLSKIPDNAFGEYEYDFQTRQDYPSIWQIRESLATNRIVPIFVIQFHSQFPITFNNAIPYRRLQDVLISGTSGITSTQVLQLNRESGIRDQLITIIQTAYEGTAQLVQPSIRDAGAYNISIVPLEGCDNQTETGGCLIDFGNTVTFNVSITLKTCQMGNPITNVTISGGAFQFTRLQLKQLCECPCSDPSQHSTDDSVCSGGRGDQVCGVCTCDVNDNGLPQYFGPECQCDEPRTCNSLDDCNGFKCGDCGCLCANNTFGDFCECEPSNCPRDTNPSSGMIEICSGRGRCEPRDSNKEQCTADSCECDLAPRSGRKYFQGRFGSDGTCQCDPDRCYNIQYPDGLCFNTRDDMYNNSACVCNGCECFGGLTVENGICVEQQTRCDLYRMCIEELLNTIPEAKIMCRNRTVRFLNDDEQVITDTTRCEYDVDCTREYFIPNDDVASSILVGRCPRGPLAWIIAGSLVGAILLLGLIALIVLKLCLLFLERVEYRRFTKELKEADFAPHENPLYVTPQIEYQNPIRRSSSKRPYPQQQQRVDNPYTKM